MELLSLKEFLEAKEFLIMVKISLQKSFRFAFLTSRGIILMSLGNWRGWLWYNSLFSSPITSWPKKPPCTQGKLCKPNSDTIGTLPGCMSSIPVHQNFQNSRVGSCLLQTQNHDWNSMHHHICCQGIDY